MADKYFMFKLKNREFSFTVDVFKLPCGLNGALYFSAMDEDGGKAGGTWPVPNTERATVTLNAPRMSNGLAARPTPKDGYPRRLIPTLERAPWDPAAPRWIYGRPTQSRKPSLLTRAKNPNLQSVSARSAEMTPAADTKLNVTKMDVISLLTDGAPRNSTDSTRRSTATRNLPSSPNSSLATEPTPDPFPKSDGFTSKTGKTIKNEAVTLPGLAKPADSITEDFCAATKKFTSDVNDFSLKGGMKGMDAALERGMVLVFSLWDDQMAHMNWLDSTYPPEKPVTGPGVARGTCDVKAGDPTNVRAKFADATVEFSEVKIGPITNSKAEGTQHTGGKRRKACRSVRI
ncbi:hypothetical protein PCANC_25185 [Puccinia coronata f. sp. avenae]|uniref:Glucanase n=1 Tax=Puccinia coronata f. sp. avenae TaxID=200324 RepID=A0A2N5S0C8_9BASI|nr:hypothetical protein PCANC_25185 [Puccinia coronata f. sp. avenae]